jgi:oligopeptidase A
MREKVLGLDEEVLKPYFSLEHVLNGLFALSERILGIRCVPGPSAKLWHEDARLLQILDIQTGKVLAHLAMDLYARPGVKRDGAWMHYLYGRKGSRPPFALIACNQARPIDGKPSLMSLNDVRTLFHEFGHALQHMLTTVSEPAAAGIENVEWDAVEIASQFWEQWVTHPKTLQNLTQHYQTGAPLPEDLLEKIRAARVFREGFQTVRQLAFALGDLELHHRLRPHVETPRSLWRRMATEILDTPPHANDRMLCSFSHLFSGGYSAGYYSYKWAEALAADLFLAFEESDESQHPALGRKLRDTLFSLGGSRHPAEVFKAFRGREPDASALAIRSGFRYNGVVWGIKD